MELKSQLEIQGAEGKALLFDIHIPLGKEKVPLLVFAHGFKGFKDWGCWQQLSNYFVQNGIAFLKFNFSHNGTTTDAPSDFGDLDAFGRNNFSKEQDDLKAVFSWIEAQGSHYDVDVNRLYLMGHSRGGGSAIVFAEQNPQVKALITLASVGSLNYSSLFHDPVQSAIWKKEGKHIVMNGRTNQAMPLYYQLFEDFKANEEAFDIKRAIANTDQAILIIHGTDDQAVSLAHAFDLAEAQPNAVLKVIDEGNHVLGGYHPYEEKGLPKHMEEAADSILQFLGQID